MIPYHLTERQEHKLRVDYVRSDKYNPSEWSRYRDYVAANIPGVLKVDYLGRGSAYIDRLWFESEKDLTLFLLRWS